MNSAKMHSQVLETENALSLTLFLPSNHTQWAVSELIEALKKQQTIILQWGHLFKENERESIKTMKFKRLSNIVN